MFAEFDALLKRLALSDESGAIVRELVDVTGLTELPPIHQLHAFLSTPLRRVVSSKKAFTMCAQLKGEFAYAPVTAAAHEQLADVIDRVIAPAPVYGGKRGLRGFIVCLITTPLKVLSGFVSVGLDLPRRDASDQSVTAQRRRPDLVVYVEDVVVLRGEWNSDDFKAACQELTDKLVPSPLFTGGLPYVFGMAANKSQLQLFALPCVYARRSTLFALRLVRFVAPALTSRLRPVLGVVCCVSRLAGVDRRCAAQAVQSGPNRSPMCCTSRRRAPPHTPATV
jgi:hypothetical protein